MSLSKKQRKLRLANERHRRGLIRARNHDDFVELFKKNRPNIRRSKSVEPFDVFFEGNFSILTNRNAVIEYMNEIDKMLRKGIDINADFSKSKNADLPTVCLLTAYMLDSRTPSHHLTVTIPPYNSEHRTIWDEIQFDRMIIRQRRKDFNSGKFLSRSDNFVNGLHIQAILDATVNHFGKEHMEKIRDVSSIINELVENTTLHAHPRKIRKIPWIINTHNIENNGVKEREFCIIDLGVGVYDSIQENVNKWNTRRAKAFHRLTSSLDKSSTQSRFLSRNIPTGIGSSSNISTRGKGIMSVYEFAKSQIYVKFDIITNKARVDIKQISSIHDDSEESLGGTIYYWKMRIDDNENS